jgi:hypothetical protein
MVSAFSAEFQFAPRATRFIEIIDFGSIQAGSFTRAENVNISRALFHEMKTYDIHAPTPQGPAGRDEQAFQLGMQFHEAGIRAAEETNDPDGRPVSVHCPMVVCYAFSAELYLKSIISRQTKKHDLKLLFEQLASPLRKTVEDRYAKRTGRGSSVLRTDLERFSRAFEDWRYVFEAAGQMLHFNLLDAFVKSVFESIRLHRGSWKVPENRAARLLSNAIRPIMTLMNVGGGTFIAAIDGTGGTLNTPQA